MNLLAGDRRGAGLRDRRRSGCATPCARFAVGKMRGERLEHNGMIIWNDCYNSNPEAARAMLDVLAGTPARRRIAVLGEMLELGRSAEDLHRDVGQLRRGAAGLMCSLEYAAPPATWSKRPVRAGMSGGAALFFEDPVEAGEFVRRMAQPGDAVLFKGSRGVARRTGPGKVVGLRSNALLPALRKALPATSARSASFATTRFARPSPA